MDTTSILMVYCTAPDHASAERIASAVVERGLAACVNMVPSITSVYRWQGTIQRDTECLLLIKTTQVQFERLERHILSLHPYELPEIIAVKVAAGHSAYLNWVHQQCS